MSKTKKRNSQNNNNTPKNIEDVEYIPEFKLSSNNSILDINLKKDQEIAINKHVLSYYDSHIKVNTKSKDGVITGFFRKLVTGESIFKSYFKGTDEKTNRIRLSHFLPSEIIAIKIKAGQNYLISNDALLAFTNNLKFKTDKKFKNLFVAEGIFQILIKNESSSDGMIWLHGYGGCDEIKLKENESIKLANSLFLAAEEKLDYKITTLSGAKSFFFGTTTTLMQINGPCSVYINNKNYSYFLDNIYNKLKKVVKSRNNINYDDFDGGNASQSGSYDEDGLDQLLIAY